MGTTLTGTTPQDTYDSLIKVTDNGPLSGSLKVLTDGLGNNSTLSLSTAAASIAGTLAVTGNATFDTNTLFVDATNNRVGVGTITPDLTLHLYNSAAALAYFESTNVNGAYAIWRNSGTSIGDVGSQLGISGTGSASNFMIASRSGDMVLGSSSAERMRITAAGNAQFGDGNNFTPVIQYAGSGRVAASPAYSFLGDLDTGMFNPNTSNNIAFATAATERFRITDNGVTFNGDTAAANALDDYEEGTFTPSVAYSTSGTPTQLVQVGLYTKIGRSVQVQIVLNWNENGSVGNVSLQGLPFTCATTSARPVPSIFSFGLTGVLTSVTGVVVSNGTSIDLFLNDNAGTALSSTYTDADQDMYVTLTYQAA